MNKAIQILITFLIILTVSVSQAQVRIVAVDPGTSTVSIKNFGSATVNIASFRLCHLFTYPTISSLTVVSGSSNLTAGSTLIVTGVNLNATASDLGLYLPSGAFTDPNSMLDFVQWGSAGNGREPVAVSKGIWSVGDFITVAPPYVYTGDGLLQFGLIFWQTATSVDENNLSSRITIYPNPVADELTIKTGVEILDYKILNSLGELVFTENKNLLQNNIKIDFSNYDNGNYILYLTTNDGVVTKKVSLIK